MAIAIGVAFGVDQWIHRDRVGRNVSVAGFDVGDGTTDDIARVLRSESAIVEALPVVIETDGLTIETTVAEAGISIDEAAVTDAVFAARDANGIFARFDRWWESLRDEVSVPLSYEFDPEPLRSLVESHPDAVLQYPQEPAFHGTNGGFGTRTELEVVPAIPGSYLDAADVVAAVAAAVDAGPPPYRVTVSATPIPTRHTAADLDAALARADELTTELDVSINGRTGIISREVVRGWVASDVVDGELVATFVDARVQADVEGRFSVYADPLPEPKFTIDEGQLAVDLGVPARTCCAEGVGPMLFAAASGDVTGTVELPTVRLEDDGGAERAAEYGITELVSSFTTNHACCQNRVKNIQRIADLVRGHIIQPGETFSVNDFIGRRTRAKGFVSDGVIQGGHFTDQVGGGISQFATTTFNAAFFAGLDIPEYQSHSIYISRYPYGREATLSFPLPDLELTNNTPHAVMLWTSYTSRSITVEVWSTKYYEVEQTRQTSYKIGACTRVNTYRQRVAPDGSVIDDFVFATYRPGEGLDCNGNRTPDPEG